MCGICGSTEDPTGKVTEAMSRALRHRGTDEDGLRVDTVSGVALGSRRLSIVDLSDGSQPRTNEDGTVWTVFNGEIYNHPALRAQLLAAGHTLRGRSDTEVLPHLYEEYGVDLVHALEGMFALAIWDTRERRLLLARDRFGEKPLFYTEDAGGLIFASELTGLRTGLSSTPDLDPAALDAFFVFGYAPGPSSVLQGVRQLQPGHTLEWDHGTGRVRESRYWHPPTGATAGGESVEELAAEAGRLLDVSIQGRLLADVPLGVFLSGGVDSTLIAALAARRSRAPIRTFTVGYDAGSRDERAEARAAAELLGAEHCELTLTGTDVANRVPSLLSGLDQPLADQALVPLHAVAEFAKRDVTVAIGGEGADELFGGYPRYRWLRRAPQALPGGIDASRLVARLPAAPPSGSRARRAVDLVTPRPALERHLDWVSAGRRRARDTLYGPALRSQIDGFRLQSDLHERMRGANGSVAGAMMLLDQRHWLPDNVLFKADRAGMLVSLEIRTPYLHRELAEFAASIPADVHVSRGGKQLLRRLLGVVAPQAAERRKEAFLPPAAEWLRGPLSSTIDRQIQRGSLYSERWFDREAVRSLHRQHAAGDADWSHVLWPLLAAGLWLDRLRGDGE